MFATPSWLVVTETPTLTIVKYCAYADGYRRQARRYRVVSQIQLTEVPPPLTLSVGNWGNIWSHLGDRLRQRSK